MEKLTKDEVRHVSTLARIEVSDEEIEKYQISLKKILDEIDKIKDIDTNSDILITPTTATASYRDSEEVKIMEVKDVLKNTPRSSGGYIEVPVVINE